MWLRDARIEWCRKVAGQIARGATSRANHNRTWRPLLSLLRVTAVLLFIFLLAIITHGRPASTNGFAVTFASVGKASDVMVLPNLWLYVEAGKPATPFLPAGSFTAVFEGNIAGELRANYYFKAEELGGSLKLEVNNEVVLDTSTPGALSRAVRINKGPNPVKVTFTSAAAGDSFVRLGWTEKGTNVNPIPDPWITHGRTPEVQKAELLYQGRELFLENRCAKCHAANLASPVPELSMDAPTFDGIGARRKT
jgi:hypothetical protein